MKARRTIDFEYLDRLASAGATAQVIIEILKSQEGLKAPRAKRQGRARQTKAEQGTDRQSKVEQGTPSQIAERELFSRGKQMFGPRSGGLISRLRQHHGYDDLEAHKALDLAATKSDPREYLLGSMRTKANGPANATMAAFDDLLARVEGGASEGGAAMRDITPGRDRSG